MEYRVEGANLETGNETSITIDAANAQEAEAKARLTGMVVSAVHSTSAYAPANPITPSTSPRPSTSLPEPEYVGLFFCGRLLRVLGFLCYIGGVIGLLVAIGGAMNAPSTFSPSEIRQPQPQPIDTAILAVGAIASGALLHAIGEFSFVLRDIGRKVQRMRL